MQQTCDGAATYVLICLCFTYPSSMRHTFERCACCTQLQGPLVCLKATPPQGHRTLGSAQSSLHHQHTRMMQGVHTFCLIYHCAQGCSIAHSCCGCDVTPDPSAHAVLQCYIIPEKLLDVCSYACRTFVTCFLRARLHGCVSHRPQLSKLCAKPRDDPGLRVLTAMLAHQRVAVADDARAAAKKLSGVALGYPAAEKERCEYIGY